jgi:hypothetical protein
LSRLNLAPIVEGHGENSAVMLLIRNLWSYLGGEYCNVLTPIRRSRGKLLKHNDADLSKAINLALIKLDAIGGGTVLILIDAEDDCENIGSLGPILLKRAKEIRPDADISCVIANVMYETWFVACAESLGDCLELGNDVLIPENPEDERAGKGWIKKHIRAAKYSETVDQPRLTSRMDFGMCRKRSPSFNKLCRELQARILLQQND